MRIPLTILKLYEYIFWLTRFKEFHSLFFRNNEESSKERPEPWSPSNVEQILEVVNKQKAPVLYYSLAAGRLYAWLMQPHKGKNN